MIVAISRPDRRAIVPTPQDTRVVAETVPSIVASRLGWMPKRVVPGREGTFWAYRK